MDDSTIKIVLSFGGVVLGFALSQMADWIKNIRISKITKKSLRKLIYLEIEKNHRLLSIFWHDTISSIPDRDKKEELIPLGNFIVENAFPQLSRSAWENNLWKVSESFSHEEISRMWDFYEDLLQLKNIYEYLSYINEQSENANRNSALSNFVCGNSVAKILSVISFQDKAKNEISRFKLIIEGVIKNNGTDKIFSV
jgi:hypothetical protein